MTKAERLAHPCPKCHQKAGAPCVDPLGEIMPRCHAVRGPGALEAHKTAEAERTIRALAADGFSLHGFGFKVDGLARCADVLASADSLAWSDGARKQGHAERQRLAALAASPSLFDRGEPQAQPDQNSARTALDWLDGVRVSARITEEAGQTVCPHCGSTDVHPPISDLTSTCVDCGESWGDITRPDLLNPHFMLT
jgi:hypothetical protein